MINITWGIAMDANPKCSFRTKRSAILIHSVRRINTGTMRLVLDDTLEEIQDQVFFETEIMRHLNDGEK